MGADLRAALIEALDSANQVQATRSKAPRHGEKLQDLYDPEFQVKVARTLARLKDPRTIPVLAGALGTGGVVTDALADFGERAVPDVRRVVVSPESDTWLVNDGLEALRFMVEAGNISAKARKEIRSAAKMRLLSNKQNVTTLWWAIDLGAALNDPELKQIIRSPASDRKAIVARGLIDPYEIDKTQRRALDRLAGVAAFPRKR